MRWLALALVLTGCGEGVDVGTLTEAMHCDRGHNPHCPPDAGSPDAGQPWTLLTLGLDGGVQTTFSAHWDFAVFFALTPDAGTYTLEIHQPDGSPWTVYTEPGTRLDLEGSFIDRYQIYGTWTALASVGVETAFEVGP